MKKTIMMCFVLLAGVITATADDVVSVSDTSIPKGANGTFSINLTNTTTEYTGFEMVLTLPTGVTFNSASLSNRFSDHTVSTNKSYNSDSQKTKIVVSSTSSALITGTSGALLTIEVNVSPEVNVGVLTGASLTDVKFSTGTLYNLSDVNFNLNITNGIVLDENDTALPAEQSNVNVTVNRTLKADVWNTVCFPFAMTKEQVSSTFGSDVKACYLTSCSTSGSTITVGFTSISITTYGFSANYPYLIKPKAAISTLNLTGIDINPNESAAVRTLSSDVPGGGVIAQFIGTLKAGTVPINNLFISDNDFYYSDGSNTIKGFRGYFWLSDFSSGSTSTSPSPSRLLLSIDGEPTAIYSISSETGAFTIEDGKIYNLNGMELDTPTKKGIYIQNGKKIVVK